MILLGLHKCPCCSFYTLEERAIFDICRICWWEDDGQDDPHADRVMGGPNGRYSLTMARHNFIDHGDMYDLHDGIDLVRQPTEERQRLVAYVLKVIRGEIDLSEALLATLLNQEIEADSKNHA